MLGLGGYASSDEEDEDQNEVADAQVKLRDGGQDEEKQTLNASRESGAAALSQDPHQILESGPALGPAVGPSMPLDDFDDAPYDFEAPRELTYEETREALRNLTMPPVPSFNIPPSPPGSPLPGTSKKFANFLKLKKQGVHFNERLANTSALKNPTLFEKLKSHAGISSEEQYATTLSENLAVPTSFPPWAYADELNKSQTKIRQRKEDQMKKKGRDAVDFVPASGSAASSKASTPRGGQSAAERVLGGVDSRLQNASSRKR